MVGSVSNTVEILEDRLFIDGRFIEAANQDRLAILSPIDGQVIGEVAFAGPQDVESAVEAAERAFVSWSSLSFKARAGFLDAIADHLDQRRNDLARLTARNNGKPLAQALMDVDDAVACYRYYASLAGLPGEEDVPGLEGGLVAHKDRLPLGPVALIVPWNFPLTTAAWKVAPALVAGCTVVLKVSEVTPFAELSLGSAAIAAGLPPGVLNILVGGPEAGERLVRDLRIAKISFTGSNRVGSSVMAAAAERAVPVTLELGGKSPIIVFDDVDPDWAAQIVAEGIFTNCGQVCSANSRLIVQEGIADALEERLVELARTMTIGDPLDPATTLGPLTSSAQYEKVIGFFDAARAEGLACLAGGDALGRPGYYVAPTIYGNVPVTSRLWREEIFGPVLVTRRFRTEAEGVALAADTPFGLGAVVLSGDIERAERVGRALRAGNVWVNTGQMVFPQGNWGGFGASGFGRELGLAAIEGFTGIRQIISASPRAGA
ncbi:aldehyde dehydrogenase family protein [Arsenicitalea aurantiaca]|uniref:aldehyde dehydrogenase family protein n=1 Tax=Arsenicitalea aurantiaca TaxID=1783274 RepID=UPI00195BFBC0|nr:aldehyde dehydrogenase family protein [Arsenicitalea aurantiaca]